MKWITRIMLILVVVITLSAIVGFNTVRGLGQDVSAAGEGMQDASGR